MRFLDRVPRAGCGGDASIRGNHRSRRMRSLCFVACFSRNPIINYSAVMRYNA
jgi:hypothetical protein